MKYVLIFDFGMHKVPCVTNESDFYTVINDLSLEFEIGKDVEANDSLLHWHSSPEDVCLSASEFLSNFSASVFTCFYVYNYCSQWQLVGFIDQQELPNYRIGGLYNDVCSS